MKIPDEKDWHGHTLVCGSTASGKTTLAHKLASFDDAEKRKVLVFDPVMSPTLAGEWPKRAECFDDREKFTKYLLQAGDDKTSVYIDEAGDLLSQSDRKNWWILTRGRHLGYSVTLISQRPKMIAPSCRSQCSRLYMFRLAIEDAKEIGRDFGHSDLHKKELDKGDFVVAFSGHASVSEANVFDILTSGKGSWKSILSPSDGPSR